MWTLSSGKGLVDCNLCFISIIFNLRDQYNLLVSIKLNVIIHLKIHKIWLQKKDIYFIMFTSDLANDPAKDCIKGINPKMTPQSNAKISLRGKHWEGNMNVTYH